MERSEMAIGEAIEALLTERGWTTLDLAKRSANPLGTIVRYVSRRHALTLNRRSASTVLRIAAAFEIQPEYFREYREWKARRLLDEAIGRKSIELEDVEYLLKHKKRASDRSRRDSG